MGLFSKKPPCPICGGKIGMFLPAKVEGELICDACSNKIDMDIDIRNQLTLQGLREYLAFYEENQLLKSQFVITEKLDFGFFDTKLIFDLEHHYFCMNGKPDKTIFQGAQLKSFRITEDNAPLFEGSAQGMVRYNSTVHDKLAQLAPQIQMMVTARQMADTMEQLRDDDDNRSNYRPQMDIPEPFHQFYVELVLDHPYWNTIRCDMAAPSFSNDYPDMNDYLRDYRRDIEVVERLVFLLMAVAFPSAGETLASATAGGVPLGGVPMGGIPAPAPDHTADDIIKFKNLLDAGVITQEEFAAKKKQLLGL